MNKKQSLSELVNTFYKKGKPCNYGCNESELDSLWNKMIKEVGHYKNVYAVKYWIWYDIPDGNESLSIVKADYILRSNNRRFDVGDWVRTSPIINFTDNSVCETSSSYYILVGEGSRKNSDSSIFSFFG